MIAKIYLETTMFNFYYAPEKSGYETLKAQTRQVFDQIKAYNPIGIYRPVEVLDL
jgi:hypothetical protein